MDGDSGVVRRNRGVGNNNSSNVGDGLTEMDSAWDGSVGEVYGSSWENYRTGVAAADANAAARGGHRFGNSGSGGRTTDEDERLRRGGARTSSPSKGKRRNGGGGGGGGEDRDAGGGQGRSIMVGTVLDASHPAFERQNNLVYGFGQGSKVYPQPEEFPEVRA